MALGTFIARTFLAKSGEAFNMRGYVDEVLMNMAIKNLI